MEEQGNDCAIAQAQQGYFVLPVELRAKILGFLDDESLLTSRLVCSDWRMTVDDVHESKIWKPYFARQCTAEVLLIFRKTRPGTRFSTAEEVNQFMEDHPEDRNPFINHTLIINSTTVEQHTGLCEAFPGLVARFGNFVQHCVYFVNAKVPGSVHHISTIFQMTNLRSLTIFCNNWFEKLSELCENLTLDTTGVQALKGFQSLTVLGANSWVFLQPLSSAYGPPIKRLRCWNSESAKISKYPPFGIFPNLDEVKVCNVAWGTLLALSKNRWPLKRLSMKMNRTEMISFEKVLGSINVFAGTLESFHLQGTEANLLSECGFANTTLQFPKVTDLRVPYFFKSLHVINAISRIFIHMKHLQLVDSKDMVPKMLADNENRIEVIGEMLEPLWETLPASLDMISVRYRKYNEAARRSIIHKYFQKRTDLNRNRNN